MKKSAGRPKKSLNDRINDADMYGNRWLALGNEYAEAGNEEKAEKCYQKGQYWMDRSNVLRGCGELRKRRIPR